MHRQFPKNVCLKEGNCSLWVGSSSLGAWIRPEGTALGDSRFSPPLFPPAPPRESPDNPFLRWGGGGIQSKGRGQLYSEGMAKIGLCSYLL